MFLQSIKKKELLRKKQGYIIITRNKAMIGRVIYQVVLRE